MTRHTTVVRYLAVFWATLQLAAPGMSAIADGRLARESAGGPVTHVEATTSASCPVVHSLDCALCRYLSISSSNDSAPPLLDSVAGSQCGMVAEASIVGLSSAIALPHGRAPPTI